VTGKARGKRGMHCPTSASKRGGGVATGACNDGGGDSISGGDYFPARALLEKRAAERTRGKQGYRKKPYLRDLPTSPKWEMNGKKTVRPGGGGERKFKIL